MTLGRRGSRRVLPALCLTGLLTACASTPPSHDMVHARVESDIKAAMQDNATRSDAADVVSRVDAPYIRAQETPYQPEDGDIILHDSDTPVVDIVQGLARAYDYSLMVADATAAGRRISIDLVRSTPEDAMRMVASMAGMVAVIDPSRRTVLLADSATQTYRIPTNLLQQLETRFNIGGNPAASSTTGVPQHTVTQGMLANFQVSGSQHNDANAIAVALERVAGRDADVQIVPELGIIHVHADAAALMRVHDFLTQFCRDAMSQVEIQASIIDVKLDDQLKYGINWQKILGDGTRTFAADTSIFDPTDSSYSATVTTATTQSVIKALQAKTDVDILTQPYVIAMNHTPSVLFDGSQLPYLGGLKSTVGTTTNPAMTVDARASFAVDGISLSIQPDILNDHEVQISIVPVLSSVANFTQFTVDGTTLQVPTQQIRQSYMKVLAQSGQTIILGGSRFSTHDNEKRGIPGVMDMPVAGKLTSGESKDAEEQEMIILMSTRIIPAPQYDPLVSESP